jgi:hypothetical protein
MSPSDYTGVWKVVYDWQTLITGAGALLGGIAAYVAGRIQASATQQAANVQIEAERKKAQREIESLRRALGIEVRLYAANALTAHYYCKSLLYAMVEGENAIPSILIEDRAKLPPSGIYANSVIRIGELGDCARTIVRFFTSIAASREAADRLQNHPFAENIPTSEIARAADGLIKIAGTGSELFPFLKTDIQSEDGTDMDAAVKIGQAYTDWLSCREQFYPFHF